MKKVAVLVLLAALLVATVAGAGDNMLLAKGEYDSKLDFGTKVASCVVYAPTREVEVAFFDLNGGVWNRVVSARGDSVYTVMRGTAVDVLKLFKKRARAMTYRTLNTTQNDSTAIQIIWGED